MSNGISTKLEQIKRTRKWLNQGFTREFERREVEEIGNTNWFKQTDAPISFDHLTSTFYSNLKIDQHAYLSYKEENTKFSLAPSHKYLNLQSNQIYRVSLKGKKDNNINVSMTIIFFKDGKRVEDKVISFNKQSKISISKDFDNIRLAIKIVGAGKFKIEGIQIEDISVWEQLVVEEDKKFLRYNDSYWYIPNDKNVIVDSESSSFSFFLESGKYIYFPYLEANVNFSAPSQNPIQIDPSQNLSVLFEGEKDLQLDVKLFIVLYNENNEKMDTQQIDLNHRKLIIPSPESKKMRLAIRVMGSGSLKLSTVAISGVGYWLPNSLTKTVTNSLKYDYTFNLNDSTIFGLYTDNKILFHNDVNCFESRLGAKQYRYLPCLENSEINAAPRESVFVPKQMHYYEFYPSADTAGNINLDLFIASYRNGERINLKQVPFNHHSIINFPKETTDIKLLIRINGQGLFRNVRISINEEEIQITNRLDVELNNDNWFVANKLVTLKNEKESLVVDSKAPSDKRVYVSYKEKNNSFAIAPVSHLLPINKDSIYEFNLKATPAEGIEFLPMVVEYAGETKLEVHQLKLNSKQVLRFDPDTTDIRISFRISGSGTVTLEKFVVKEMMVLNDTSRMKFVDSKEPYELNLIRPKPLNKLKMAVIFDEFTTASYAKECELITFTPENWLETLTSNKPDLLMVESAWVGNGGSWNKRVGYYGEENMKPLFNLIKWCNQNNIPTVFWNKEDPVHFNRFIKTALKFDYIFTTDENVVPNYKEQAGHENVYSLPFAAQPAIHNPIKIVDERENKACFAGSYYRLHEDRARDMDRVLDYAAKYGLDIYDRNYEKNLKGLMPNHRFPERFEENIKGSLRYYEIDKAYKGYSVMINVNTVKDSPTMFSRRVFEGLACGTPVVSTYAKGIEQLFGDLVYISENEEQIDRAFNTLLNNPKEYRQKSMLGIREVLSKHTYTQRLKYICEKIGLPVSYKLPKVTVIAFAHSKHDFYKILDQYNRQKYEDKELYVLVDTFDGYLDLFKNFNNKEVKTFIRSYMKNYQNIHEFVETPYITYFSSRDYYAENYLLDLMLCTTFTDSQFIGKSARFNYDEASNSLKGKNTNQEYEFVTTLLPASTIVKTDVFSKESLQDVLAKMEGNSDYSGYLKYGNKLYSNDKYNYISDAFKNKQDMQVSDELIKKAEI